MPIRFIKDISKKYRILIPLLGIMLLFFFSLPFITTSKAIVDVDLIAEPNTVFKIYWNKKTEIPEGYSEDKSSGFRTKKNKTSYKFKIGDLRSISSLRIDPSDKSTKITIREITIKQNGIRPIVLRTHIDFKKLKPINHIKKIGYNEYGISITSSGTDPQLELQIFPSFNYLRFVYDAFYSTICDGIGLIKAQSRLVGLEFFPVLILLLDAILVFSICATLLSSMNLEIHGTAIASLATGILFLSIIVISGTFLGAVYLLSRQSFLALHFLVWLALHASEKIYKKCGFFESSLKNSNRLLQTLLNPLKNLIYKKSWQKDHLVSSVLILSIAGLLILYLIPAILTLPLNYDANNYRLPRIGYWLQEKNIYHYNALDPRQLYMPINADLAMLWATSFFKTGYPLVHLAQFMGGLLSCAATYAIGRNVGLTKEFSLMAVVFLLGIPNTASQLFTSQTDLFTTGCLISGLFFLMVGTEKGRKTHFLLFGLGLGLALGAKGTVFFWGPGLLIFFLGLCFYKKPQFKKLMSGLLIATVSAIIVGGFNYAQNLASYENPLAPTEQVKNDTFRREENRSINESALLRGMALFWQVFEPSSNISVMHPVTNFGLKTMENIVNSEMEGLETHFVNRFKKATQWVGKVKLSEDYTSFGFFPFSLFLVGGLVTLYKITIHRNTEFVPIMIIFLSVILYFVFFPIVRAWSVHQYRYAVLLTPFMSIIAVFAFQTLWQSISGFGGIVPIGFLITLAVTHQAYMSTYVALKSRNHGWHAVLKSRAMPNYVHYWRDIEKLVDNFNDRSYKMGLLVGKGFWTSLFFRSGQNHKITYLPPNPPDDIDEKFFHDNDIEVMISQNLSGIELKGRFNLYQSNIKVLAAIVPEFINPELKPWVSKKGRWRDLWTPPEGSFQIGNWDKDSIQINMINPVPFERNVVLRSKKETLKILLPKNQTSAQLVDLKVNPDDEISWEISPVYEPYDYSDTTDTRQLGIRLKVLDAG